MSLSVIERKQLDALLREDLGDGRVSGEESSLDSRSFKRMVRRLAQEGDCSCDVACGSGTGAEYKARVQTVLNEATQGIFNFGREFEEYNARQDEKEKRQRLARKQIGVRKLCQKFHNSESKEEKSDESECILPFCGMNNKIFKANCIVL
eukprot:TRINITY_DN8402_c0_g1_i1.p2 TRINITY_DN8402_c0_g1~~TRINITY_DN8402_c0_g1_i1.p2  ORF type:complete len:150 (+),score=32.93 TRINITY_DN8402_c0_g1_i1:92-541(+)